MKLCKIILAAVMVSAGVARADDAADASPRWWKGNLHTHTLWSDGNAFPEMSAAWYHEHGYQFLALSDHNVLSQGQRWMKLADVVRRSGAEALDQYKTRFGSDWVETRGDKAAGTMEVRLKPLTEFAPLLQERGKFLMIQAEEVTDKFDKQPVHMGAINVLEMVAPRGGKSVAEVIQNNLAAVEESAAKTGQEVLAHLNHPNFVWGVRAEDLAAAVREQFFEVYNGHPGVHQLGDEVHAPVEKMWDIVNALRIGKMHAAPVYGLGNDDTHVYNKEGMGMSTPGRGWVMVRSNRLTPESLLRAMKAGDFYASSGVTLKDVHYAPESGVLSVDVEPEAGAEYTIRFVGTPRDADLSAEVRVDKEGRAVTGKYSPQIGMTLAETKGTHAEYKLTGKEMYVRAVVISSKAPAVPSWAGQKAQAWTQPVGWEKK